MRDRGLSTVVGYALMLVAIGLLTAGVLVGTTGYVDDARTGVAATELRVVGNHLAADLIAADDLAATVSPNDSFELESDLVERVAGHTYRIEIATAGPPDTYDLVLTSAGTDASAAVTVRTAHPVATGRVHGGDVVLTFRDGALEVADA